MFLGGSAGTVWCVRVKESRNQKHSSVPMHAQKTLSFVSCRYDLMFLYCPSAPECLVCVVLLRQKKTS